MSIANEIRRVMDLKDADVERLQAELGNCQQVVAKLLDTQKEDAAEIERLKEDAERYRFLRDEDNWGCDNDETTESRWGDLGECHGGDFDAFVDKARAALAGKETTHG